MRLRHVRVHRACPPADSALAKDVVQLLLKPRTNALLLVPQILEDLADGALGAAECLLDPLERPCLQQPCGGLGIIKEPAEYLANLLDDLPGIVQVAAQAIRKCL